MELISRRLALALATGAALGAAPNATGRLRDCAVTASRQRRAFLVRGSWQIQGRRVSTAGTEVPVGAFGRQFIVGTLAGVLPSATPPGAGEALIAIVDGPGGRWNRPGVHWSWLTIPPPLDDPAAMRRRADHERGALGIPRLQDAERLASLRPAETLADLREDRRFNAQREALLLTEDRSAIRNARLHDGVVAHEAWRNHRGAMDTVIAGSAFTLRPEHPTPAFITSSALTMNREAFFALPDDEQDRTIAAERAVRPEGVVVEDSRFEQLQRPGMRRSARGLMYYGRQHLRRSFFSGVLSATEYQGPGSTYEDVTVVRVGHGLDDHANAVIIQSVLPYCTRHDDGAWTGGSTTWRRCNFDMPSGSSPNYVGSMSSANISFWGSNFGLSDRGHVFDFCRINGGTYCIDVKPWPSTRFVGDITFRHCAFGRHFEFEGNAGRLLNLREFRPHNRWGNIRFENCFWEDSGELIDELNGVWNPGPNGQPLLARAGRGR
ncbi:MAG: hypothetical protein K2X11_11550 [Acetobacteraceae bacterium]|nr:hypothetical protein [Acetobacteraceae bacterium]